MSGLNQLDKRKLCKVSKQGQDKLVQEYLVLSGYKGLHSDMRGGG